MRLDAFATSILRSGLDEATQLLDTLIVDTLNKIEPTPTVYEILLNPDAVTHRLGKERLDAMVSRARGSELYAAVLWLIAPGLEDPTGELLDKGTLVHKDLRELTLGHRRAMARRARGDELQKLVVDPDPIVITNLLANPACTESHALAVASRRPTTSPALEMLFESMKWGSHYRVRASLAQNPHLRVARAVALLPCLVRKDLTAISRDGTLAASVRESAQHLIALSASDR